MNLFNPDTRSDQSLTKVKESAETLRDCFVGRKTA